MGKMIKRIKDNKVWTKSKEWACENETLEFLNAFVCLIKPEKILEIGTFEGDSSIAMGKALKKNKLGQLYTFDIKDYGQLENIKKRGLEDIVIPIIGSIPNNFKGFDMAFIDGGHSFEAVKKDLEVCKGLINYGGFILGHDVIAKGGVNKAFKQFCLENKGLFEKMILPSFAGLFILKRYE